MTVQKGFTKGFTIVELLLTITIIGILSGVMLSVINVQQQQNRAADAIRISNLERAVEGIEAYYAAEGEYPDDSNGDGNPIDPAVGPADEYGDPLEIYITQWPNGEPAGAVYDYYVNASQDVFGVVVESSRIGIGYKYRSDWNEMQECTELSPSSANCEESGGDPYP